MCIRDRNKMIIKQTPVVRRDWPAGTTGTDKSEGKFAKLSADGQTMSLVTVSYTHLDVYKRQG